MAASNSTRRQFAALLGSIAVLILLLIFGLLLVWRPGRNPAPTAQSPPAGTPAVSIGPVAKIAAWVEPPKPKQIDNSIWFRRTRILTTKLRLSERNFEAATRARAGEYSQRITTGVNSQSGTGNP